MQLTDDQIKVRDTRDNNILVSAAAGSGKTKVLVDRILSEIMDENNPIDVDRILVVTFTNAAAAEMKERIRKRIEKEVAEYPENKELRKQATLIHNAQIRTIDSFCSWVVKNYFYEIDQDPSFRIGSSGELSLMSDMVLDDMLSRHFMEKESDFMCLADAYVSGRKVDTLKDMITSLHTMAMSSAWPEEWYDDCLKLYEVNSFADFASSPIVKEIVDKTLVAARECVKKIEKALSFYSIESEAKEKLRLLADLDIYNAIAAENDFNKIREILMGIDFGRFTFGKELDELNKEAVKDLRNDAKGIINGITKQYYAKPLEEVFESLMFVKCQAKSLVALAREYTETLGKLKKKKNTYDFNDIEHMALAILRNPESKEHEKRPVALELSSFFAEVMVDEYQDSNRLQEAILTAVSCDNNYFTVGDVKQSIYAFRQADPAIFMEKYESYVMAETKGCVRIDLDNNFRSRKQVLDFCNQVFEPLMQKDIGNVAYDKAASLKVGATNYIGNEKDYEPEILIGGLSKLEKKELGIKSDNELEAAIIAERIRKLIDDRFPVSEDDPVNEGKKILRPIKLNDIVILMRATSNHADTFIKVLKENGIPAYVEEENGFFDRDEIQTVLAMLEVVNNPNNDIPLAAVLHSKMFDFSTEELANIRAQKAEGSFFNAIYEYYDENPENLKLKTFIDTVEMLRDKAIDTPIHEMISIILKETGFGLHISALPMGAAYTANINKLIDEAIKFEAGGNLGMSRFVEHINNLRIYKEELGLAKTVSENDVAVRIMTIHKSKGLEFPVVFLARSAAGFMNDKGNLFYHPEFGVGLHYKNPETRVAFDTVFTNTIKEHIKADRLGEEMRILYVALTRAKEKLVVVGSISPTKEKEVRDIIEEYGAIPGEPLDYRTKFNASGYLEWIIRSLRASESVYERRIIGASELIFNETEQRTKRYLIKNKLLELSEAVDKDLGKKLNEELSFEYSSRLDSKHKIKYSVSEIKHQAMEENISPSNAAVALHTQEDESYVPMFMRTEAESGNLNEINIPAGALYGTAMHRFLECFDFAREDFATSFQEQFDFMTKTGMLSVEESKRVNSKKLELFLASDTAKRMHKCAMADKLVKEQPFVLGGSPKEIFSEDEDKESMILVQGIIDVFYEEEDGVVLLDYKTDRVDEPEALVLRYEKQLRLYEMAIERALEVKVKDVQIYSFSFDKTISLGV